jgi:16S rRNA (guanine(527)-N(7))-methyltransferase RsmG
MYVEIKNNLEVLYNQNGFAESITFPSDKTIKLLASYIELLQYWNKKMDLVAPGTNENIIEQHLNDSIAAWSRLKCNYPQLAGQACLDVGSGAGFPGVVIAILESESRVFLCEPRHKRQVFLQEVRRSLAIKNIEVLATRVEAIKKDTVGGIGFIISRAFGKEEFYLKEAARLCDLAGFVVQMVGPSWVLEQKQIESNTGLTLKGELKYTLPPDSRTRSLVIWEKH